MLEAQSVAVRATEKRFRVLKHEPTGATLDEHGDGLWPPDQFTYRLRNEGAIRIVDDEPAAPAPAPLKKG